MRFAFAWLPLLLGISMPAQAATPVELVRIEAGRAAGALGWPARQEWKWQTPDGAGDGVLALYSVVTIFPPSGTAILSASGRATQLLPGAKLLMSAPSDRVILRLGSGQAIEVFVRAAAPLGVLDDGCAPLGLALAQTSGRVSNVLGISCRRSAGGTTVTVTAPKDVEWRQSSVPEQQGKGERWKQFAVPESLLQTGGEIAKFDLATRGVPASYRLYIRQKSRSDQARRAESEEARRSGLDLRAGIGGMSASFTTPATKSSAIDPVLAVAMTTPRFGRVFDLNAGIDLGLPLSGSLTYYDLHALLGAGADLGRRFRLTARAGFLSMGAYYNGGEVSFQLNTFALGADIRWQLGSRSALSLGLLTAGKLPSAGSSLISPYAAYEFPLGAVYRGAISLTERSYQFASETGESSGSSSLSNIAVCFSWIF